MNLSDYFSSQFRRFALRIMLLLVLLIFSVCIHQVYQMRNAVQARSDNIAKALRSELISGVKPYVYEICRSLFTDRELVYLKVSSNGDTICDFKRKEFNLFTIEGLSYVQFDPELLRSNEVVALVQSGISLDYFLRGVAMVIIGLAILFILLYFASRRLEHSIKIDLIEPLYTFSKLIVEEPENQIKIRNIRNSAKFSEVSQVLESHIQMMTALKETQDRLIRSSKNAAMVEISRQVAHDIRNPLGSLKVGIQVLSRSPKEAKGLIDRSIERIEQIAEELLNGKEERTPCFKLVQFRWHTI